MVDLNLSDLINNAQFKRGGRTPAALDCQGLAIEVMRRYGHTITDYDCGGYTLHRVAAAIAGAAADGEKWQPLDTPEPGCVVTLALDPGAPDDAQHIGVCLGGGKFVHILESRGVLVSRLDDRFFAQKIRGYYRWIG